NDSGTGSLRQAILDSNAHPGADAIYFNIAGAGVHTIQPTSALPIITDAVTLDATTQPGFAGTPIIELDGTAAGLNTYGVAIQAGDCTLRGFVINRFTSEAIAILGSSATHNVIEGNYIGTNAAGTAALPNLADGILIDLSAANNTIGGTTAGAANV